MEAVAGTVVTAMEVATILVIMAVDTTVAAEVAVVVMEATAVDLHLAEVITQGMAQAVRHLEVAEDSGDHTKYIAGQAQRSLISQNTLVHLARESK